MYVVLLLLWFIDSKWQYTVWNLIDQNEISTFHTASQQDVDYSSCISIRESCLIFWEYVLLISYISDCKCHVLCKWRWNYVIPILMNNSFRTCTLYNYLFHTRSYLYNFTYITVWRINFIYHEYIRHAFKKCTLINPLKTGDLLWPTNFWQ